jgi:hypothetical protein
MRWSRYQGSYSTDESGRRKKASKIEANGTPLDACYLRRRPSASSISSSVLVSIPGRRWGYSGRSDHICSLMLLLVDAIAMSTEGVFLEIGNITIPGFTGQ